MTCTVLAVDLGAESGRVMAVHFDGQKLALEEVSRFPNTTVAVQGTLHWNFLRLWQDIQTGIAKGKQHQPASLGVDTWGVDFALLDKQGKLIGNPVHYRDSRTQGMQAAVFERVPREEVFAQTGIQFMPINTLYQMMSLVDSGSPQLEIAACFLTAPDLLNYWLTGVKGCEFTNATTTQMLNPQTGSWADNLLGRLDIPRRIFPEIIQPGTRLGLYDEIPVVAPACHDTGSAVAGVPAQGSEFAYISSGTWSLVGLDLPAPIINAEALAANVTNEGGINGRYRFLKNVMGLWILQQCLTTWRLTEPQLSYADLVTLAERVPPLERIIPVDDPRLLPPGDHPEIIRELCQETSQPLPTTKGEVVRCVIDSLAFAYREVLEKLVDLSGQPVKTLHIVGGGTQNRLLNQATANATGLPVLTGPIEATVLGNALVQLMALGEIRDIAEGRQLIRDSFPLTRYDPVDSAVWNGL